MTDQNTFKKKYCASKMHMFLTLLIIIGSINWGLHAINYNLVDLLSLNINQLFNTNYPINKLIYLVVCIAGISLAIRKDTWLPFLGWTVFPSSLLEIKNPENFNTKINILTKPNSKIIYWAATGKNHPNQDVYTAYGNLKNSGVTVSDDKGNAELHILEGDGYIVPSGQKISKHIHYRVVESNTILGDVESVYY